MSIVLVIDDEESVRDSVELALEDTGYEVVTACDGQEGVAKSVELKPDLIFLDLNMPGIDGVETLRRIRAAGVESPVYIATAFMPSYLDALASAAREGLTFGLGQKPLSSAQIVMIARGQIEGVQST